MAKDPFRLTLTDEQKKAILKETGRNVEALELSIEELEERIAPFTWKLGGHVSSHTIRKNAGRSRSSTRCWSATSPPARSR